MNSFGHNFRVTVFGESHGPVVGVVLDGVPAGIPLTEEDFAEDIGRRASGAAGKVDGLGAKGLTPRREADRPHLLSGVYDGHTTGAPLTIEFDNADIRSEDYEVFEDIPRPGHVDYVASVKYAGLNDPRGGGHFSGRLTLPVVAAGVVAKKLLGHLSINSHIIALGGSEDPDRWEELLETASKEGDSLGAVIECVVSAPLPIGLGEPFWDSVESIISHAIFAIPGVRGIEFGDGFKASAMKGSEHNDPLSETGPTKNGAGGVNGGLTNGAPIVFRVAFKPTSSISKPQKTWNFTEGREDTLAIKGRHDVCFARRCPVIVEAMTAIVIADLIAG